MARGPTVGRIWVCPSVVEGILLGISARMAAFDVISNFHNSAIPLRSLNPLTMSLIRLLSDKAFGMAAKYFQRTVANKLRVSGECTAGLRGRCKSVMLGILVVRRSEN